MKSYNFDEYLSNWSYTGNWLYVYHSFLEAPLDLEALGLSLHSLLVNPALYLPASEAVFIRATVY